MVHCVCPHKLLLCPPIPTSHTLTPSHASSPTGTSSTGIVWPGGQILFHAGLEQWSVRILLLETWGPRVAEAGHLYLNIVSICLPPTAHTHTHTHTHTDMSLSLQYSAPPPCHQYLLPAQRSCPHQRVLQYPAQCAEQRGETNQ